MIRNALISAGVAAFLLSASPAQAQETVADPVVARIEAEGYTVSTVKRSWLGRIVITASNGTEIREVVLNRSSGEVLRDQRFADRNAGRDAPGNDAPRAGQTRRPSGPNGNGRSGGRGDGGRDGERGGGQGSPGNGG